MYKRDKYTCQNCGKYGGQEESVELHAHHIVPKSSGGTHSKSNLQTLCKDCHNAVHGDNLAPSATIQSETNSTHTKPPEFINLEPFKNCPICGNVGSFKIHTNIIQSSDEVLANCSDCRTEFYARSDSSGLFSFLSADVVAKNSEYDINGLTFAPAILKKMEQEGFDTPSKADKYVQESREYKLRLKQTVAVTCAIVLLFGLLGVVLRRPLAALLGIVIPLFVGFVVIKKLNSEIRK